MSFEDARAYGIVWTQVSFRLPLYFMRAPLLNDVSVFLINQPIDRALHRYRRGHAGSNLESRSSAQVAYITAMIIHLFINPTTTGQALL